MVVGVCWSWDLGDGRQGVVLQRRRCRKGTPLSGGCLWAFACGVGWSRGWCHGRHQAGKFGNLTLQSCEHRHGGGFMGCQTLADGHAFLVSAELFLVVCCIFFGCRDDIGSLSLHQDSGVVINVDQGRPLARSGTRTTWRHGRGRRKVGILP